ncbi:hypothetical protein FKR81_13505 [Lentzea tibetensis]|uniref:Uncharacterized protein n=1 Tax=Lentzea tibetensis TaxID=2591470 RepID=A0A563EWK5_9PSEU|nr:hypothetical protein [Lentzea tibetensis]TWP51861.1 hypothetical protein FKR81_13505 [Lentzea tibetensis]
MKSGIQRVLAVLFAFVATVALAQPASAAEKLNVTVEVTNKGSYSAHLCGFDWLGGYCRGPVRRGTTEKFTVHPRSREDLVWARVVTKGFDEQSTVASSDRICFEARGTNKNPTVQPVDCG